MKKFLLTAAISLTLTGVAFAAPAEGEELAWESTVAVEATDDNQPTIIADPTPSEEVNYIEESPTARKMSQAEKRITLQ